MKLKDLFENLQPSFSLKKNVLKFQNLIEDSEKAEVYKVVFGYPPAKLVSFTDIKRLNIYKDVYGALVFIRSVKDNMVWLVHIPENLGYDENVICFYFHTGLNDNKADEFSRMSANKFSSIEICVKFLIKSLL